MKVRYISPALLSLLFLFLVARSSASSKPQPMELPNVPRMAGNEAANAPWEWDEIDISGNSGLHTSVTYDSWDGRTYISYYDAQTNDLRVTHDYSLIGNCETNNYWYCQTVDSGGDVGMYSAIHAYLGVVNISYYDATNGDLKWAQSSDHPVHYIWRVRTIDRGSATTKAGQFTSIAVVNANSYISYYFENQAGDDELRLAQYVGGGGNCGWGDDAGQWRCRTIHTGEGIGQYSSLVVDSDLYKYIAYYDAVNGDLWMATNRSGSNCGPGNSWSCFPVSGSANDVGKYASMYLDSSKHYHIAYYDATDDELKYAYEVGSGGNCGILGSTQCDTIDTMQAEYHPVGISIAEDGSGYPIIAYQAANGSLKTARPLAALDMPVGSGNCGPEEGLFLTWYCQTIHRHGTYINYRNGDYASIIVKPSGLAAIAYNGFIRSDPVTANLYLAYQQLQNFFPLVQDLH